MAECSHEWSLKVGLRPESSFALEAKLLCLQCGVRGFACEMCRRYLPMGDDAEARAEAEGKGIDPEDSGLVCDECYSLTPWGGRSDG